MNDNEGNPIEIAAVVVWRVIDTAEAVFEVHDYENYLHVQTESAVRNLASSYTYDTHDEERISLRGHTGAVAEHLKREIQDRLSKAGIEVMEARITISPTRQRLPRPCCSGSRRARSSPRASASSREPSGWCRWRSTCSPARDRSAR